MAPIIYFLLILVFQLLIIMYFKQKSSNIQNTSFVKLMKEKSIFKNESKRKSLTQLEKEKQLKKSRRQLRRNLMTLNYISYLESTTENENESVPFAEVINLKRRLQREVIRNTSFVKEYSSLSA